MAFDIKNVFLSVLVFADVHGKVIHLVERAPPQTTQAGSGSGGVPGTSGSSQTGSTTTPQAMPHGATHDRNANSYVMLGTLNLPVNVMDPQQIQAWALPFFISQTKRCQMSLFMVHTMLYTLT